MSITSTSVNVDDHSGVTSPDSEQTPLEWQVPSTLPSDAESESGDEQDTTTATDNKVGSNGEVKDSSSAAPVIQSYSTSAPLQSNVGGGTVDPVGAALSSSSLHEETKVGDADSIAPKAEAVASAPTAHTVTCVACAKSHSVTADQIAWACEICDHSCTFCDSCASEKKAVLEGASCSEHCFDRHPMIRLANDIQVQLHLKFYNHIIMHRKIVAKGLTSTIQTIEDAIKDLNINDAVTVRYMREAK